MINYFRENLCGGVAVSYSSDLPQTCKVVEYNFEFLKFQLWVAGITSVYNHIRFMWFWLSNSEFGALSESTSKCQHFKSCSFHIHEISLWKSKVQKKLLWLEELGRFWWLVHRSTHCWCHRMRTTIFPLNRIWDTSQSCTLSSTFLKGNIKGWKVCEDYTT